MTRHRSDRFADFAARHGLHIEREELAASPRDVVAPPHELESHTLVTLHGPKADAAPVRTLFVSEPTDSRAPSVRDALWWLASDSWAVERAERDCRTWAATYRYPDAEPATARLFRLHVGQADNLAGLLGETLYQELHALYESEVSTKPRY